MSEAAAITWFEDTPLTNFYEGELFTVVGVPWPGEYRTGEHAFQAQKAAIEDHAILVAQQLSPGTAKYRGRSIHLRSDWEEIKFDVMRAVLKGKFAPGRYEAEFLLGTGDALLIEGTHWNDRIWGVDLDSAGWPGQNWLGKLLMERREELRHE